MAESKLVNHSHISLEFNFSCSCNFSLAKSFPHSGLLNLPKITGLVWQKTPPAYDFWDLTKRALRKIKLPDLVINCIFGTIHSFIY